MHILKRLNERYLSNIDQTTDRLKKTILSNIKGMEWPPTAEYCVEYSLKCWPMNLGTEHVKFFDSKEEMSEWLDGQREWACLEDNQMAYVILKWDLGPNFIYSGEFY